MIRSSTNNRRKSVRLWVLSLAIIGVALTIACGDHDAAVKQIIAAYYNVDVSKVGDKPIAPACGRLAIAGC